MKNFKIVFLLLMAVILLGCSQELLSVGEEENNDISFVVDVDENVARSYKSDLDETLLNNETLSVGIELISSNQIEFSGSEIDINLLIESVSAEDESRGFFSKKKYHCDMTVDIYKYNKTQGDRRFIKTVWYTSNHRATNAFFSWCKLVSVTKNLTVKYGHAYGEHHTKYKTTGWFSNAEKTRTTSTPIATYPNS